MNVLGLISQLIGIETLRLTLSFPICPSRACHVDELIVILQSIIKVDEVEDSNKSILNKLSQIDPCRKMTSSNKISRPFQLKWKSYPNYNNVKTNKRL